MERRSKAWFLSPENTNRLRSSSGYPFELDHILDWHSVDNRSRSRTLPSEVESLYSVDSDPFRRSNSQCHLDAADRSRRIEYPNCPLDLAKMFIESTDPSALTSRELWIVVMHLHQVISNRKVTTDRITGLRWKFDYLFKERDHRKTQHRDSVLHHRHQQPIQWQYSVNMVWFRWRYRHRGPVVNSNRWIALEDHIHTSVHDERDHDFSNQSAFHARRNGPRQERSTSTGYWQQSHVSSSYNWREIGISCNNRSYLQWPVLYTSIQRKNLKR